MKPRPVAEVAAAVPASDGAGVRLYRSLGGPNLPLLDPFLLLDEMHSDDADDYIAGFPDHPHRGFETVTIMIQGRMRHEDSVGNVGDLGPGSVQWMTAGKGIVHSEMPQQEAGLLWGFQMWVNLPAAKKMMPPRYQDIAAHRVPEVTVAEGAGCVRVLAGSVLDAHGPVEGIATDPLLLDVRLDAGAQVELPVEPSHQVFAYVFEGEGEFGDLSNGGATSGGARQAVVFGEGDGVCVRGGDSGVRFLLAAARPLGEPIARYGPFVMNTREELLQAFRDYESGRLTD